MDDDVGKDEENKSWMAGEKVELQGGQLQGRSDRPTDRGMPLWSSNTHRHSSQTQPSDKILFQGSILEDFVVVDLGLKCLTAYLYCMGENNQDE